MHGFRTLWLVLGAGWLLGTSAFAAEFRLSNGDVYNGEGAAFDDYGIVIRREIGGYTPKIGWGQLTQETLIALKKNPQAAKFVEPFIETPPEVKPKPKKKEIVLKEVPRIDRPAKSGFFASLGTPAGMALLAILFLANLFMAYEVAVYRQRPAVLVCGISAVLPVFGPIVFLSLPGAEGALELPDEMAAAGADAEALVSNPLAIGKKTGPTHIGKKTGPTPTRLGLASVDKKGQEGATLEGAVFKRGDTTFNRRFFESKFAGFFRVIQGETEKDLVIVIRTGKNEYVVKRISRISMGDMHVQVLRGGTEAQISFGEISEVLVRRKDAKG